MKMSKGLITAMSIVILITIIFMIGILCGCSTDEFFGGPDQQQADDNYQQYIDDPKNQEVVPDEDGVGEPIEEVDPDQE